MLQQKCFGMSGPDFQVPAAEQDSESYIRLLDCFFYRGQGELPVSKKHLK